MSTPWKHLKWWQNPSRTNLESLASSNIPGKNVYRALQETPYEQVSVVILGQDPYPTPGNATGLAFSVPENATKIPATLRNIFDEYQRDLHYGVPSSGDLTAWARRGVLLWNSVLSVRAFKPRSHRGLGWETLTNEVLDTLCDRNPKPVFILWGMDAQSVFGGREAPTIRSVHPSPLSARKGFFGSRPFSTCNDLLIRSGQQPINWRLQ